MPQPPYSPDMAPCDFFMFSKLKRPIKGWRFATNEEIKTALQEEFKTVPKRAYQKRWHKCIISEGDYFEADNIDIDE